jgi:hypothetical protein
MSWSFLNDYDVYNFTFNDIKHIDIDNKQETLVKGAIPLSFDV